MEIELTWPRAVDERLRAEVHEVLHAVVARGGAVGWQSPPGRSETDAWLDGLFASSGALVVARVDGALRGTATWRRASGEVFEHVGEVGKVAVHPAARGLGVGSRLVRAVVGHARAAGLEVLTLGVRGNNHGAIQLYESLGFREWGRLPNVIAVGDVRFDDVRMHLPLGHRDGVVLHGSAAGGLGSSPGRPR